LLCPILGVNAHTGLKNNHKEQAEILPHGKLFATKVTRKKEWASF